MATYSAGCSICSESMTKIYRPPDGPGEPPVTLPNDVNTMVTPCGHAFHAYCITKWMMREPNQHGSCPNCRKLILQKRCSPLYLDNYESSFVDSQSAVIDSLESQLKTAQAEMNNLKAQNERLSRSLADEKRFSQIHVTQIQDLKHAAIVQGYNLKTAEDKAKSTEKRAVDAENRFRSAETERKDAERRAVNAENRFQLAESGRKDAERRAVAAEQKLRALESRSADAGLENVKGAEIAENRTGLWFSAVNQFAAVTARVVEPIIGSSATTAPKIANDSAKMLERDNESLKQNVVSMENQKRFDDAEISRLRKEVEELKAGADVQNKGLVRKNPSTPPPPSEVNTRGRRGGAGPPNVVVVDISSSPDEEGYGVDENAGKRRKDRFRSADSAGNGSASIEDQTLKRAASARNLNAALGRPKKVKDAGNVVPLSPRNTRRAPATGKASDAANTGKSGSRLGLRSGWKR